jgi:hypothetical protein
MRRLAAVVTIPSGITLEQCARAIRKFLEHACSTIESAEVRCVDAAGEVVHSHCWNLTARDNKAELAHEMAHYSIVHGIGFAVRILLCGTIEQPG